MSQVRKIKRAKARAWGTDERRRTPISEDEKSKVNAIREIGCCLDCGTVYIDEWWFS